MQPHILIVCDCEPSCGLGRSDGFDRERAHCRVVSNFDAELIRKLHNPLQISKTKISSDPRLVILKDALIDIAQILEERFCVSLPTVLSYTRSQTNLHSIPKEPLARERRVCFYPGLSFQPFIFLNNRPCRSHVSAR